MEEYEEKDDNKRKSRNASEKKRRDQFNVLVTELGSMVSPRIIGNSSSSGRKMDKTTVLKSTIAFLRQQSESNVKSQAHEIQEDWKPSFLSNEEFMHLMLEALEGFILVFGTDGGIVYASESITSLLGHLPREVVKMSLYDLVLDSDKPALYGSLSNHSGDQQQQLGEGDDSEGERHFLLHLKKGGAADIISGHEQEGNSGSYEPVKLTGYFRKWLSPQEDPPNSPFDDFEEEEDEDDDDCCCTSSAKSGYSRMTSSSAPPTAAGSQMVFRPQQQQQENRTVFVCTARMQTTQLVRELPLAHTSRSEFTSRYSLEWKFLFLDHRAPPIIGYLPFELLGTSGYDYYHSDDLERIAACHEALMQTGEGTSCCHRFLSKGQQWIWLQTRYFITYHQWNSKPEFVVATHRVLNYADVLKELRGNKGDPSETGSVAGEEQKSSHYPTTGSPTWSSRSSVCNNSNINNNINNSGGGGNNNNMANNNSNSNVNSTGGGGSGPDLANAVFSSGEEYFSQVEYDNLNQFMDGKEQRLAVASCQQEEQQQQQQQQQLQYHQPQQLQVQPLQLHQPQVQPQQVQHQPQPQQPQEVYNQSGPLQQPQQEPQQQEQLQQQAQQAFALVSIPVAETEEEDARPQVVITAAQAQLQEQLRAKHAELTRRIMEQQDELRRISEQLLMSQYGLVPANAAAAAETAETAQNATDINMQSFAAAGPFQFDNDGRQQQENFGGEGGASQ